MFDSIVLKWLVKKQKKTHERIGSASDARNKELEETMFIYRLFFW